MSKDKKPETKLDNNNDKPAVSKEEMARQIKEREKLVKTQSIVKK